MVLDFQILTKGYSRLHSVHLLSSVYGAPYFGYNHKYNYICWFFKISSHCRLIWKIVGVDMNVVRRQSDMVDVIMKLGGHRAAAAALIEQSSLYQVPPAAR